MPEGQRVHVHHTPRTSPFDQFGTPLYRSGWNEPAALLREDCRFVSHGGGGVLEWRKELDYENVTLFDYRKGCCVSAFYGVVGDSFII